MNVRILPGRACGSVFAPPSKSIAHRMLICAGLAPGESRIEHVEACEDVLATMDCLRLLGASCCLEGEHAVVKGVERLSVPSVPLPCRESGSTLRFLIPVALLLNAPVSFCGTGRLMERPQTVYERICRTQGLTLTKSGQTLCVRGPLRAGTISVSGNVSSQFITGLLLALPRLEQDSRILIEPPIGSRPYIQLTIEALARFGVQAEWEQENALYVPGRQRWTPYCGTVEGDWSGGAYFLALDALHGNHVCVSGLDKSSKQGDRICASLFRCLRQAPATVSLADCPDLGPLLFALSGIWHGGTFTDTERLRIKESDRLSAMQTELAKCGIQMVVQPDRVTVLAGTLHAPTEPLNSHGDHRVVMALAILLTVVGGELAGAEAVRKSYPHFWEALRSLGVFVTVSKT